nr:CRISPR-associated endonuclease Cas2 [Actinomyces oris]
MRASATWGRTSPAASRPSTPATTSRAVPTRTRWSTSAATAPASTSARTVSSSTAPTACRRRRRTHGAGERRLNRLLQLPVRTDPTARRLRRTQSPPTQGPGQRRPLLRLRDPAGRVHGRSAGRRTRDLARGAARLHRQASQPLPRPPARQARLAAALEGWGYRLQESVFQLRLEPAELDEVRRQVTEIINQADDVIRLYPLCDSCLTRSEIHGITPALDDAGLYRGVW